jgi:cytidine deaminase
MPDSISRRTAISALGVASLGLIAGRDPMEDAQKAEALRFSDTSSRELQRLKSDPKFSGVIRADDVKGVADREHWNPNQVMMALLPLASSYSRAPISNFHVGAVAQGLSGSLYLGANLEVPHQWLGSAVHAEQSAIGNAFMHSEEAVTAIAVNYAPCGHCRQFLKELSLTRDMDVLVLNEAPTKLSALLPHSFGPKDLNANRGALPPKRDDSLKLQGTSDPLAAAALDAARLSYAPHSQSPSGVAIETSKKRTFRGSYIENAAYNPSLSPLQMALIGLVMAGGNFSDIATVALVETNDAKITQRSVTEAVLTSIAPAAKLRVLTATARLVRPGD